MKLNKIDEAWNSANSFFMWRFRFVAIQNCLPPCQHALTNSPIYCDRWKIFQNFNKKYVYRSTSGSFGGGGGGGPSKTGNGGAEKKQRKWCNWYTPRGWNKFEPSPVVVKRKKSNALRKNLEKRGPTVFKFQSMCRPRHPLRQKEGKSFIQYLNIVCTGAVLLEFN